LRSAKTIAPYRVGIGYDVHPFAEGRPLILGGVEIPFARGLDGHSDADVLLHAISDALLGAAALGDIGVHFPNTNAKYKGISSLVLLERVGGLLAKQGFTVGNIDATLLLEKPRVMKFAARMASNIAARLDIPPQSVSVKATTNEGMGFIGRGDGCAAMAIALIMPTRRT
jgi:2-C-methyl-D-erythritol 2,4-cyclodiphosphate synthase